MNDTVACEKMNNIVGIIDMDRFTVRRKFHCRELGMIGVGKDAGESHLFDMGIRWQDLSNKEQKSCMFLTKNIHELPFAASRGSIPLCNLNVIVKHFYNNIKQDEESTIAYKGGHLERDLLKQINIPAINLEDFGCPKAEFLFGRLIWLETCGQLIGTHAYHHCPKVEVEAFALWLKEEKEKM